MTMNEPCNRRTSPHQYLCYTDVRRVAVQINISVIL